MFPICFCLIHTLMSKAAEEKLAVAESGIVAIYVSCQDENGKSFQIREGTGFLIGQAGSSQNVITSGTLLEVSDEELEELRKSKGLEEGDRLTERIEVLAANDVMVEATALLDSSNLDCAVLSLASPLYDKEGLKLGSAEGLEEGQIVFSIRAVGETQEAAIYGGKILVCEPGSLWIRHTAKVEGENYGSPLIDNNGNVIGLNAGLDSDGSCLAVPVDGIREVLDVMGIPYANSDVDSERQYLQGVIEEYSSLEGAVKKYTKASRKKLREALEAAQTLLTSLEASQGQYIEAAEKVEETGRTLVLMSEKMLPVQIGIGVLAISVLAADIILVVKRSGKKRRLQYLAQRDKEGEETDYEATVSLENIPPMPQAFLIRLDGSARVPVNRTVFRLGKAQGKVDFVITGNSSISRHHADIVSEDGEFFCVDKNSLNHTMVNGEILQPEKKKKLHNRDKLRLANEEFIFEIKG